MVGGGVVVVGVLRVVVMVVVVVVLVMLLLVVVVLRMLGHGSVLLGGGAEGVGLEGGEAVETQAHVGARADTFVVLFGFFDGFTLLGVGRRQLGRG